MNEPLNTQTAELKMGQYVKQTDQLAIEQEGVQPDSLELKQHEEKQDGIEKVVFMGAPSTGKSTICKAAAKQFNSVHVDEFGRTYWEQNQTERRLTPEQLLYIAEEHIAIEERTSPKANKYLFVDTNALTTWHFALDYHQSALPELCALADKSKARYQHVFLCADDIPFEDTWERSGTVKHREFQVFITKELNRRDIQYTLLIGSVEQRLTKIAETLA
ncbi:MAG: HTH-type transcriptional repressor of NAD biosynthesis genes [Glaciecola sp.]